MSVDTDKFYRIIGELDELLAPGAGEKFWLARPIFAEMDRSFLNGWALRGLQDILDEKAFLVFRDRNTLTINVTRGYAVSLAMIDRPPDNLYLYPQHYMARNVGRVPLTVSRYNPDRALRNDVYDPDVRLMRRDEFELQPGESLERNGGEDVLDWYSAGTTGFALRLHSEALGDYEWAFDRATGAPKGVTVLDSFSSQVASVMQMLTSLGAPLDADFAEMGLTSRHFHVRWETLKMISQLAPEKTEEAIARLKDDPHPAIRRGIEKTLGMKAGAENRGG
ncbi:MAG TPA: hypothetical protein VMF66_10825 [Candidatus Acidoferrum sp.]|nr:hypothetical protein [Candidatus Acidoferrum sp.]